MENAKRPFCKHPTAAYTSCMIKKKCIHIRLHGALRDKLPGERNGRLTVSFKESETITVQTAIAQFSLRGHIQIALNQELIENQDTILHDGDTIEIFRPAAGG